MRRRIAIFFSAVLAACVISEAAPKKRDPARITERRPAAGRLIPPAAPLVACDPYFSIWSCDDQLAGDAPRHWTGKQHGLCSLVRIDGKAYRLMGSEPGDAPALPQTDLSVLPTRTVYAFRGAGVDVKLTFLTPALPYDLEVFSRPVTYLTWDVRAADGRQHAVSLYFDAPAEITVNETGQAVVWSRERIADRDVIKIGSQEQPLLLKKGDNLRIDWGYLYVMAVKEPATQAVVAAQDKCRRGFAGQGRLPEFDRRMPRAAGDDAPAAAFAFELGNVGPAGAARRLLLAYDDLYSIQYFKQNLRPFWRRGGAEATDLLQISIAECDALHERCAAFDRELLDDLRRSGGEKYAQTCALAYRQMTAGNKLAADANGQPLIFPKENFSNGCIATVDVIYPMAPFCLLFGPSLTKAMLVSNLDYAGSPRWKFPFAPHDLGTYPLANGQVYGGGEKTEDRQMPVEESGNMLILLAALAQMEGRADFAAQHWPVVRRWAEYLREKGFDPENQLCTDDFAGHLAHNVNLSAKAIVALGAFGKLCRMKGDAAEAQQYEALARAFAARWIKEADDGDHFRLAFDKPGTWSQKYNLVWDRILGLNLFPASVLRKELDFYKRSQGRFGLPLDSRKPYTKLDWTVWTACLTGDRSDFEALTAPGYDMLNHTPHRVPMTDWYWTQDAKKVGFQARPVVGGLFLKLLYEPSVWKKWAGRDATRAAGWAPLPVAPVTAALLPTAEEQPQTWRYTTQKPPVGWNAIGFDDSAWKQGPAGFGTKGTPGALPRTEWRASDLWLRRTFTLPPGELPHAMLRVHHDEDAEVFLNGVLAAALPGYVASYDDASIAPAAQAALRAGENTLAVHCRQTRGGQYIDVGLLKLLPPGKSKTAGRPAP